MYINTTDEELYRLLLSYGYKPLNSNLSKTCKVWTFENVPHLFSLLEDKKVSKKYFISDTLKMTF